MMGRGVGIHEQKKIPGIHIEPEKEIVLSMVYNERAEDILHSIDTECD